MVGGAKPETITKILNLPQDTINKYYYSYKEHLEKQGKLNEVKSPENVTQVIQKMDEPKVNISSISLAGGDPTEIKNKFLDKLELENKLLAAVMKNKNLRDEIHKMEKNGLIDKKQESY